MAEAESVVYDLDQNPLELERTSAVYAESNAGHDPAWWC